MFTDNCESTYKLLVEYCILNLLTTHNRQKIAEKHRSVNNVFWRVVAGRIRRGRGPDAALGPPVGHP